MSAISPQMVCLITNLTWLLVLDEIEALPLLVDAALALDTALFLQTFYMLVALYGSGDPSH